LARGAPLPVRSHVVDGAKRCDRLLLMRDGELLADDTVDGVLAFTGTDDVEDAFLRLIDRGEPDLQPHDASSRDESAHVARHARTPHPHAGTGSEAQRYRPRPSSHP